jgi:lysyl-tRNA synthetase class 1
MFWADRIAGEIVKRFENGLSSGEPIVIRDEKTVSGRVHVGSMRGVAIHGAISEALKARGIPHKFLYEFNDFDPMDDIPSYLPREKYVQHLGKPLRSVPSPDGSAANFAEYFANDFKSVIQDSGFEPEFYYSSEKYLSGAMDGVIREALEGAAAIRRIYKEVSGGERPDIWLPISVVCPQCGKLSTVWATDFDGETVAVHCHPDEKVKYTRGCGFEGRVSPFGGNAKLPWKPEWAAKWKVMNVDVEGAGKDHSTKGGSRDVANHISKEVFKYEPPFDVPYEFFLVGGKKMSSSKGMGSSAREIADLLPPKIFRLALLSKDINQAFNFDPEGDTIPVLFDLYDKLALGYKTEKGDDYAKLFEYIHPAAEVSAKKSSGSPQTFSRNIPLSDVFLPRFSQIAFIVQMPHMNLEEEAARMKGSALSEADIQELKERAKYAKRWLKTCAPERFVFTLQDDMPEEAKSLSEVQKKALSMLKDFIASAPQMQSGEDIHAKLHSLKEEANISPADLFSAIYLSFLGKSQGPKAGWFLSVLDRGYVLRRLEEVTA